MTLENDDKRREYFLEKLPGSAVHLSAQGVSPDAMGVHQAGLYEPFNHRSGFLDRMGSGLGWSAAAPARRRLRMIKLERASRNA